MIEFLIALTLWLIVFIPSSFIASLAYRHKKNAGVAMQVTMLVLSLLLILFLRTLLLTPLSFSIILFGGIGFLYSFLINVFMKAQGLPEEVIPKEMYKKVVLFLLLAPLSEELLNRGLIEGYLLMYGNNITNAILFSAILFSLPHALAFKEKRKTVVVISFILGILIGYAYYLTGIVGAFLTHSCANMAGLYNFKKSHSIKSKG